MSYEHKLYFGQSSPKGMIADATVDTWLKSHAPVEGYTVLHGSGVWQGESEPSTVMLVNGPADLRHKLTKLARDYDVAFDQSAVYYTRSVIQGELISRQAPLAVAA
jgi:uncharacterized protein DUF3574